MTVKTFKPAAIGEVRGPFQSSPGNSMLWQACYYTSNCCWRYEFAKTASGALNRARDAAAHYMRQQ